MYRALCFKINGGEEECKRRSRWGTPWWRKSQRDVDLMDVLGESDWHVVYTEGVGLRRVAGLSQSDSKVKGFSAAKHSLQFKCMHSTFSNWQGYLFPFTRLNVSGWGGTKTVEVWISQVCFWAFYFRAQLSIKHHKTETLQARSVWPTTAPEAAAVRTNEVWMPTIALQAKSNINSYDWWKLHHALTQISNGKD